MAEEATPALRGLPPLRLVTRQRSYRLGLVSYEADGVTRRHSPPRSLATEALRLGYMLRNRERWASSPEQKDQQQRDAAALLHGLGLSAADLRELAVAGPVVVHQRFAREDQGWDARILPWEFVLARATRPWRTPGSPTLTVMRQLVVASSWKRQRGWPASWAPQALAQPAPVPRVLFVQSFPGALLKAYDAQHERDRVRRAFGLADDDSTRWCELVHPTPADLAATCRHFQPDIVHLAGCDTHQGLALLRQHAGPDAQVLSNGRPQAVSDLLGRRDDTRDGYLLMDDSGLPVAVSPAELGRALVAGGRPPFFVGLNIWHSAARLAPLLVSEGVLACLGFQDSFDDALAEYFFETLYRRLAGLNWWLPQAFEQAWAELRRQTDLMPGTGIALWARAPLLGPGDRPAADAAPTAPTARPSPPEDTAPAVQQPALPAGPVPAGAAAAAPALALDLDLAPVEWDVRPKTAINYAELHNRGVLFDRFEGLCTQAGRHPRVQVEVELHCGVERARFECTRVMTGPRLALHDDIVVPLTATLMRSVSEAVLSSLFVRVQVDGRVVRADTWPLRLLPVDQWRDNLRSGRWLPSFVLPRDPAVERAVSTAQRYVRVIRDDPAAGFEGYQGARTDQEDSLDNVDLQVEAIWATLLHEWQLGYVNPPPSYSAELDSQRLRTPSALHATRMGTCIDLALLFAACLELVDIYPVVFLLDGHALPGYWRHGDWLHEFRRALPPPDDTDTPAPTADAGRSGTARSQRAAWWLADHATVHALVRDGRLVPLETVRLTEHCSFREAREAGLQALREVADFDSVLDIAIARMSGVTPLPILGDRA